MRNLSCRAAVLALLVPVLSPALLAQELPAPGDVAISELLFNPATGIDDNNGEWFEVTNVSTKVLDLSGVHFQDQATPGSTSAPYVVIPAGALPLLYPGKSFVFARKADPGLNGILPVVDYEFTMASGQAAPADHSKVTHGSMALANTGPDGVWLSLNAPANLGGLVLDSVAYDGGSAPFSNNNGIGFERADLTQPWSTANVAPANALFGNPTQTGTPGAQNSNDVTLYPTWTIASAPSPGPADVAALSASGPASVTIGSTRLLLSGGPAGAGAAIAFGPVFPALPFGGGTVLVDWGGAAFWSLSLDAAGKASVDVPIAAGLFGAQCRIQWYAYDAPSSSLAFSNALDVTVGF